MKRNIRIIFLTAVTLLTFSFPSCRSPLSNHIITGNGKSKTLETALHDGTYQVHIKNILFKNNQNNSIRINEAKRNAVILSTDENIAETLHITVDQANKEINIAGNKRVLYNKANLSITIGVPVNAITIDGGYDIDFDTGSVSSFRMTINGACTGKVKIGSISNFNLMINGASNIDLIGNCKNSNITVNGASNIHAFNLLSRTCNIQVNGATTCNIFVSEELKARINGLGTIIYNGNPKTVDQKVAGMGVIKKGSAENGTQEDIDDVENDSTAFQ